MAVEDETMEESFFAAESETECPLAETIEEAARLADLIERAVQHETGHGVRDLTVEIDGESVRLEGHCKTYYCKQLAQHAAMTVAGNDQLTNDIEVHEQPVEEDWAPRRK